MTVYYARGSADDVITPRDVKTALDEVFEKLGSRYGVVDLYAAVNSVGHVLVWRSRYCTGSSI